MFGVSISLLLLLLEEQEVLGLNLLGFWRKPVRLCGFWILDTPEHADSENIKLKIGCDL
jgi:hypothetical protein